MKRIATLLTLVISTVLIQAAFAQTTISTGKFTTGATLDADANIYALQYDSANDHYDVVKYDAPGYSSSTVLYNGLSYNSYPTDIEIASNGDVYFLDGFDGGPTNGQIITLDASNGYSSTVIASGDYYSALGIDSNDDIFVAQYDGSSTYEVVKYDVSNSYSTSVIYNGLGLNSPYSRGLTIDTNDNIYVLTDFNLDGANGKIIKLTAPGYSSSIVDQGDYYVGLAADGNGDLFATAYDGTNDHYDVVQYTNGTGTPSVVYNDLTYSGSDYPFGLGSNRALGDLVIPDPFASGDGALYYYDRTDPVTDDADGNLTAGSGVSEPVGIASTLDTSGEAIDIFDFILSDGGSADGLAMTVSEITVNVSGTSTDAERADVTWRLNGNDASNVTGTYDAGADQITFTGLSISIADGGSETYTINAYYNDNSSLTEDRTIILSVDGDTDVTTGSGGTSMGTTSAVTNGSGSTIDITASQLAFTTQPASSTSGSALGTQPLVTAQDAFGNTDVDFAETVTLTEASAGSLSGDIDITATSGVATFTDVAYTATADQESFTLTANDEDGSGSDLSTVDANAVSSDVVATKLVFNTQPAPTTVQSGSSTDLTTDPVVQAVDANDVVDTGYSTDITLAEVNGAGSAVMSATGDTDGSSATVSISPSSGEATFSDLQLTYTASGGSDENFNLQASSGGLTTANSTQLTATVNDDPTLTGLPSDVTVTEDTESDVDLSSAIFGDADGDNITVTFTASAGTFSTPADGSGVGAGVTETLVSATEITLAGAPGDINTYLDTNTNIKYTGASNVSGNDAATITVEANDGNGSGDVNLGTVNLDITNVNDNPTLAGLPSDVTVTEDTESNVDLSSSVFGDVDGDNITITLTASAGTFSSPADGSGVGSGVTETKLSATEITLAGAVGDINTYLDTNTNIKYTGNADVNGDNAATISVEANDGNGSGDVSFGSLNLDITAVNDSPTLTGLTSDVSITEDTESNVDLSTATFADVEGDNLTITLTASAGTFSTPADGSGVGSGVTETLVSSTEITLAGSPGDLNTYLDTNTNIKYTGASNVSGDNAATITVEANDGNGSGDVSLGTVNIDITGVNDNPTLSGLPSDITVTEDTESNVDLSLASFSDVDGDNITVTLTASAGTFSSPVDGAGITENLVNSTTITLAGTPADINTYLDTDTNLKYTGDSDVNGNDAATISVEANDGNGSGDVTFGSVNIDITAVNDPPTLTGLPSDVTVTEDTESNVDLSTATFADVEGDNLTITLTASAGTFSSPVDGSGVGSGVTETKVSATKITLAGAPGDINTYLGTSTNIKYTGDTDAFGDDAATISVEADDGISGDISLGTVNLDIDGINDEPTLTATGTDPTFIEGAGTPGTNLFNSITASAIESGQTLTEFTLTVSNIADGTDEILRFDGSDISLTDGNSVTTATNSLSTSVSVSASTATVSFNGAALSASQLQTLVDNLAYRNASDDPTTGSSRVVTITEIIDSGGTANGGDDTAALSLSSTVSLTAVNDAPVLANLDGNNTGVQAGGNAVHIDDGEDATVSNIDSQNYNGGFLIITDKGANNTANGDFSVDGTNAISGGDATIAAGETILVGATSIGTVHAINDGQGGNTLQIDLNSGSTNARVQTLIQNLHWSVAAGSGAQTFTLTLNDADGTSNSGDEDVTADFSMVIGNPPVVGNLDGDTVDFEVGGSAVTLDDGGNVTLSDADSPASLNGGNVTVTVSGNADAAEDLLQIDTGGTISLSGTTAGSNVSVGGTVVGTLANNIANGNDLIVHLNTNATLTRVQELLRAIQYKNTASPVSVFSREVSVTLTDNDGLSSITSTVSVNLAGNPPIMTSGNVTKTIDEHTASGTAITDSDAKDGDGGAADANMSYAISSGNQDYNGDGSSAFAIDIDGKLTVDDASDLDYEGSQTFSLTVEATDTFNQSVTQSVTVNLNDLAETFVVDGDSQDSFDSKSEAEERSDGGGLDVYEAIGLAQVESSSLDTIRIKEPQTSTEQIFVSGKSQQVNAVVEIASGVTRTGTNGAYIFSSDGSSFEKIINNGDLEQGQGSSVDPVSAFYLKNTTLTNGFENNGLIKNDFGAATNQAIIIDQTSTIDGDVTNTGTITGAATGIDIRASINGIFSNSGTITGDTYGGYFASDINGNVTNSGTITAVSGNALRIVGAINGTLTNKSGGTLESTNNVALQLGSTDHTVVNRGDLTGGNGTAVELGDGNDTFTAESGTITGVVDGGAGNDTFNGNNAAEQFAGGTGDDIINPGEGSDTITFGDGADEVHGTAQELNGDTITDAADGNTVVLEGETGFGYPATVRTKKDQLEIDLNQDGFGNADDIFVDASGIEGFLLVVTDDGTDTRITITDNTPPSITSNSTINFDENNTGTVVDVEATDGEGNGADQNISYTLSGTDAGLFSIDAKNGEITFKNVPNYETPIDDNTDNSYEVTAEANDGIVTVTQAITITVKDVNESPAITAISDQTINEGSSTNALSFTISDVDNTFGELTITASSSNQTLLPDANITLGGSDGNRTVTLSPAAYQNGSTTVTLAVSDGALSQSTSFTLSVTAVNNEPVISGTPAKTINEDVAYSFTPSASDQEGDNLTFTIQNKPGWLSFDQQTGSLSGTPLNDDVGVYKDIIITVSDGNGGSANLPAYDLTVQNVNDAPVVDAGIADQSTVQNKSFNFTIPADAFDDVDAGDALTLSVAGLPDGLTFDAAKNLINGSATAVDVGSNTVTVTAEDQSGKTVSTTFNLEVSAEVPGKIVLSNPADALTDVKVRPLFEWQKELISQKYEIQIATTSSFASADIVINTDVSGDTKFEPSADLARNTTFFWRVRGINLGVHGDWSAVNSFTTVPKVPAKVVLDSPADQSKDIALQPTLTWNSAARTADYQFQLATGSAFGQGEIIIDQNNITKTEIGVTSQLDRKTTYYWRVRGKNTGGEGEWSSTFQFVTLPAIPAKVTLKSPGDQHGSFPLDGTLSWETVSGASSYEIQISNDSEFSDVVVSKKNINTEKYILDGQLSDFSTYYWRVRAWNSAGNGNWSNSRSFMTVAQAPVLTFPADQEKDISIAPELSWQSGYEKTSFRVKIATEDQLQDIVTDTVVESTTLSLEGLATNTPYYWHVRVESNGSTSPYSSIYMFKTHASEDENVPEHQITFGDESSSGGNSRSFESNDYRLVGLPGDDDVPVEDLFKGEYGKDWKVFSDNGEQEDYLVEHSKNNPLTFQEGKGYWVLSKKALTVGGEIKPVPISKKDTYSITLQPGWCIISNPFTRAVNWEDVQKFNQTNFSIFGYDGSFYESDKLKPFFAYYVYNDEGDEVELEIPYTSISKREQEDKTESKKLSSRPAKITFEVKMKGVERPANVHLVYDAQQSKQDGYTKYMPPLKLSKFGAGIVNKKEANRKKLLHTVGDVLDQDRKHYTIEIKAERKEIIKWTPKISGLDNNIAVMVAEPQKGRAEILENGESYPFMSAEGRKQFEVYIGRNAELEKVKDSMIPQKITLNQNYPNPFNPATTIRFGIKKQSDVTLEVFDVLGRRVKTLVKESLKEGWHQVNFDGRRLASGTYFYRLIVDRKVHTRKMVLIK
ncbi:putative Ig domain-containing protein [Fodinibius saliphilus]|uniref:putative Ig domain-containing protein n=1 Tax=Fodinibius saliphilus TaxID=1920650 RepID=UPI001109E0E9|nr:putative Ig domain-containing protein [Fodinibius saliphilus]